VCRGGEKGCCPFPRAPFSASGVFLRYAPDRFFLTKPNASGTIEMPASLRSENCSPSARNAVRVPFGISVHLRRNPHPARVWAIGAGTGNLAALHRHGAATATERRKRRAWPRTSPVATGQRPTAANKYLIVSVDLGSKWRQAVRVVHRIRSGRICHSYTGPQTALGEVSPQITNEKSASRR
jgi:hypothetical protein